MPDLTITAPPRIAQIMCAAVAARQSELEQAIASAIVEAKTPPADPFDAMFRAPAPDRDAALAEWLDCERVVAQFMQRAPQPPAEFETRVDAAAHHIREERLRQAGDIAAIERNQIA